MDPAILATFLNGTGLDEGATKGTYSNAEMIKFIFEKKVTITEYHCQVKGKKKKKQPNIDYGSGLSLESLKGVKK